MIQAIVTKRIGATNHRPARIKATAQAGSRTIEWSDLLSDAENHARACRHLMGVMGWSGEYHAGSLPDGTVCWVWRDPCPRENREYVKMGEVALGTYRETMSAAT